MAWTAFTRPQYDRSNLRYTSDMTDEEYMLVETVLPPQPRLDRRRSTCLRAVLDGIFHVLQNGCAWANLPRDFPPKGTVYWYFRRFTDDGTWQKLHDTLYVNCRELEGKEPQPTLAIIDSQSVKSGFEAHECTGFDAGKKINGRKRHLATDSIGLMLKVEVHSAAIQDRDGVALVFKRLMQRFPFIEKFLADGGYQGPRVAQTAPRPVEIIKRSDPGFVVLPKRWVIERTFEWLTLNRRLARDVERFTQTAKTLIQIASIKLMTSRIARNSHS